MRIFFSAIDPSADKVAANLLLELRKKTNIEAFGLGQTALLEQNCTLLFDTKKMAVMGLFPVLKALIPIIRVYLKTQKWLKKNPMDALIFIDYAGFNLKLMKNVPGFKVYLIPPKAWIWKKNRTAVLKKYADLVFCIFPFEVDFFHRFGVKAKYIGNTLLDQIPEDYRKKKITKAQARAALGFQPEEKVILIMPGSRASEIKTHFPLFINALILAQKTMPIHKIICITPQGIPITLPQNLNLRFLSDQPEIKYQAMLAADFGIIKSGTSTLEAGLMGLSHIIVYRSSRFLHWILRSVIGYKKQVGLVNIALAESGPVKEILAHHATEKNIAHHLQEEQQDLAQQKMQDHFAQLQKAFFLPHSPSEIAAEEILKKIYAS
jgi:lipid-A-disaccharide synthase